MKHVFSTDDILDIGYQTRLLVLKALNKYPTKKQAAFKLGISTKSLLTYIKDFYIEDVDGEYVCTRTSIIQVSIVV